MSVEKDIAVCMIWIPGRWRSHRQGFRFDMYAWYLLTEQHGIEFGDIAKMNQEQVLSEMIYCAAVSFNKDAGKRVKFDQATVNGWLDLLPSKDVKELARTFSRSRVFGRTLAEWAVSGNEKKK